MRYFGNSSMTLELPGRQMAWKNDFLVTWLESGSSTGGQASLKKKTDGFCSQVVKKMLGSR